MITNKKNILSINELNNKIKSSLEKNFTDIWVSGEISNLKDHLASGHLYFSLIDEKSCIKTCLFYFNRKNIKFNLTNGLKIQAHGNISVYLKRGDYQLIIDYIEPEGIGSMQLAFEQLKEKLKSEGLFNQKFKKIIPTYPNYIGIVSSPFGAAIRDILKIMKRRFSGIDILIYPSTVQGEKAASEIAEQINLANKMNLVDVLIITRGGGSSEDLWTFNEEIIARSIFKSNIPIISAIGHEIDFCIADFVADLRASTPSAAAELVIKNKENIIENLDNLETRLTKQISHELDIRKERLYHYNYESITRLIKQNINEHQWQIDQLNQNINKNVDKIIDQKKKNLDLISEKLFILGPKNILKRGYAFVSKENNSKKIIKNVNNLNKKENIQIHFAKGKIKASINEIDSSYKLF